jgi:hypothetical protein
MRVPDQSAKVPGAQHTRRPALHLYVFTYITEGSFDSYLFQLIESKARFIEQALAGEITARTVEDTSDVVLSAAEIKAIASGNPQIVRKVQLETEVARLERVRAVWLDTRRNLQLERHVTEEEICRLEGRCRQWEQVAQTVGVHPHEPFHAEVRSVMGGETFHLFTGRQEAGAAVRKLAHDYQSTAAFQRQRLRGVVAHYRGLHLTVQAHAVFAADLSLALPDGTPLDTVTASTDIGVWQSVGHIVNEIPATIQRLRVRIAETHERIVTIERELARLEQWDGQQRYDDAVSELNAINAVFAVEEEQHNAEQGAAAAAIPEGGTPPANDGAPAEEALADVLLALAEEERAGDAWHALPTVIPPASESLAWMAAEVEIQAERSRTVLVPAAEAQPTEVPLLANDGRSGTSRSGQRSQRRPLPLAAHGKVEVRQLSLFELGS